jgi:transcriptional regulator with XRE-family HTH domain
MEILDKILSELKRKGLSQKELADYLDISPNNITDWKSGRSRSYTKYLPQIAKFLGTSVDYLVENHPDDISQEMRDYLEELRTNPDLRILFSLTKGATIDEIKQAVAIVKALRNKDRKEE